MVTGSVVKFSFSALDVWNNIRFFDDHRSYVKHRFAELGFEVTLWNWDRDEDGVWRQFPDGIQFKKNDSDIDMSIEVSGVVGKNIRKLVLKLAEE